MMVKMNKDSDDGEREECFDGSDSASEFFDTSDTAHSATKFEPSKKLHVQQEMAEKAFLDSVFGELPPKSLIKTNLLFAKPARPKQRPQTKRYPLFISKETFVADGTRHLEVNADLLEKDDQYENVRQCFVRIGGMLAMPVPVPGPLFTGEELFL
ncbi:unnamed protein product [Eretmochelys imbricata]